uniref:Reverse transcriptase domain-containing protein n=1 Tax=Strigamia maritima TaxID=126957 RepID=T1ILH1_STRMM
MPNKPGWEKEEVQRQSGARVDCAQSCVAGQMLRHETNLKVKYKADEYDFNPTHAVDSDSNDDVELPRDAEVVAIRMRHFVNIYYLLLSLVVRCNLPPCSVGSRYSADLFMILIIRIINSECNVEFLVLPWRPLLLRLNQKLTIVKQKHILCVFTARRCKSRVPIVTMNPTAEELEEAKKKRQAEFDIRQGTVQWETLIDQTDEYLAHSESADEFPAMEAAASTAADLFTEIKQLWPKRAKSISSDKYLKEYAWVSKTKSRIMFVERRVRAFETQQRDINLANASVNASDTLPLNTTSTLQSTARIATKLPKLDMPSFSGKIIDWTSFENRFEAAVGRNSALAQVDKLQYLLSACSGDARRLIESFLMEDTSYETALQILKTNYDSKFVTLADLKQAFLQVQIQEPFRDVLRYLWRFLLFLATYCMKMVPFGLNARPFLLNVVIRKQASGKSSQFPEEMDSLNRNMYVDDLTLGADSEMQVIQQSINVKSVLDEAKLPLVKWVGSTPLISKSLRDWDFHMR